MEEFLPYLQEYQVWIYALLGVVAFVYLQKLISALSEWQGTVFGLEREAAQRRFSTALTILIIACVFGLTEFVIVSFVMPNSPKVYALPTPTLDLLATPTVTLPAVAGVQTAVSPLETTPTVSRQANAEGCTPGKIEWSFPKAGKEITETVELKGTVNIPNLGFYKYEYSKAGDEIWTTIAAGNQGKVDGQIGFWNTSALDQGDYLLRLVVSDNENNVFPACIIPVRIVK